MRPRKTFDYDKRSRTLEEVAGLLDLALEIKRHRGVINLWQAKLKKLSLYNDNPKKVQYVICRADNPNRAMDMLCERISFKTIIAPQQDGTDKVVTLGEVTRGPIYLRLAEGTWATDRVNTERCS